MCMPRLADAYFEYNNTLQHIASQHTATHCSTLQHTATHCDTLQHIATHCNTLQRTAKHCNTLQHTATHCNTLQHTATHCNTLQHTATHCITQVTRMPRLVDAHFSDDPTPAGVGRQTNLICWAVRHRKLALVARLLQLGVDRNAPEPHAHGLSPLMICVQWLSKSKWASLAMESVTRGKNEPYITLSDLASLLRMKKPHILTVAENLKDTSGRCHSPTSPREDVCCSVLQRVAVCCSALQCVALCCRKMSFATVGSRRCVLQCIAARCSVLQCVAV